MAQAQQSDDTVKEIHLILLGEQKVGKTQLIKVYSGQKFSEVSHATMGVDYVTMMKKPTQASSNKKVHVWDTAGQERFRSLSLAFYKKAQGAVICFDLTHRPSFNNVIEWVKSARQNCPEHVALILVGTKCDLEEDREIDQTEAQQLAGQNNMQYIETSAKTNQNVNDMFQNIIDQVYNKQSALVSGSNSAQFIEDSSNGDSSAADSARPNSLQVQVPKKSPKGSQRYKISTRTEAESIMKKNREKDKKCRC